MRAAGEHDLKTKSPCHKITLFGDPSVRHSSTRWT